MPQSQRTYCVVWTTKTKIETDSKDEFIHTDKSLFFEEDEKELAKAFYDSLLKKDEVYCASLCNVLEDSEG